MIAPKPESLKVLLIEDADMDALLIERLIRNPLCEMFSVERTESLAGAIELIRQTHFDVALLDLSLPDSSGIETLHQLRPIDPRLPIVILTGHQDENLGLQAVETGAQDFLCKSAISGKALFRVLRYAIARHRKMLNFAAEAQTDFLTGLPNRRQLDLQFSEEIQGYDCSSFAMIDVDHFKKLNDTHGHAYGDHVLRQLAELMQATLDSSAQLARIGGEEFAVVLPGMSDTQACEEMELLRAAVEAADWVLADKNIDVTISIGVTPIISESNWMESSREADAALYEAKRNGRNQICLSSAVSVTGTVSDTVD